MKFEVALLVSNKASEIRSRLVFWFNTVGYPSSIRYYPDREYPVDIISDVLKKAPRERVFYNIDEVSAITINFCHNIK